MNYFTNFFGKVRKRIVMKKILSGKIDPEIPKRGHKPDIDKMIAEKHNNIVVDLYQYLGEICSFGNDLSKLSDPQKSLYINQTLEDEVNNGGFSQYFVNSSGEFAHETVLSLKKIGANITADILQEAIDQFPQSQVPKDRNDRNDLYDKIAEKADEKLSELDNQFYKYEDDLMELNLEYVKKNKDSFKF